jgi:hypothetical protein
MFKYFFSSKIAIYLSLGIDIYKGRLGEAFIPQKRTSSTLISSLLWVVFALSIWIRILPTKMNADPDPQHGFKYSVSFFTCIKYLHHETSFYTYVQIKNREFPDSEV